MTFVVGAGIIPESCLTSGTLSIAKLWGGRVETYSSDQSPDEVLSSISNQDSLYQLNGDPGIFCEKNKGSWLEALGAWRVPTVLMVKTSINEEISGIGPAYVSLCRQFSVPLLGIIQLGGCWDYKKRKLDGLPWLGWLQDQGMAEIGINNLGSSTYPMDSLVVVESLRRKIFDLNI